MATYTLPVATTSTLGGVIADGTTITVSATGVISAASAGTYINANLTGTTTLQHPVEIVSSIANATGTVAHDYLTGGSVWYHTNVVSNFTVNFTNVPTTDNRSITITLIIAQGATPYIPYLVSINGVSQTFYWASGFQPVGYAYKKDFVTFTLIRSSGAWTVVGALNSYG
jgi:hypothetical protein